MFSPSSVDATPTVRIDPELPQLESQFSRSTVNPRPVEVEIARLLLDYCLEHQFEAPRAVTPTIDNFALPMSADAPTIAAPVGAPTIPPDMTLTGETLITDDAQSQLVELRAVAGALVC